MVLYAHKSTEAVSFNNLVNSLKAELKMILSSMSDIAMCKKLS